MKSSESYHFMRRCWYSLFAPASAPRKLCSPCQLTQQVHLSFFGSLGPSLIVFISVTLHGQDGMLHSRVVSGPSGCLLGGNSAAGKISGKCGEDCTRPKVSPGPSRASEQTRHMRRVGSCHCIIFERFWHSCMFYQYLCLYLYLQ